MADTHTADKQGSTTQTSPSAKGTGDEPGRPAGRQRRAELVTDQGRTSIADTVVAKVAGIACREVSGVHDMGTGMTRAFGTFRERVPMGSGEPSPAQGVNVEVGERQAAVDLDVVVDYGASIVDVAQAIRKNVVRQVEGTTGLEVSEVNISVDDVYLGESEPDVEPRVK